MASKIERTSGVVSIGIANGQISGQATSTATKAKMILRSRLRISVTKSISVTSSHVCTFNSEDDADRDRNLAQVDTQQDAALGSSVGNVEQPARPFLKVDHVVL